MFPMPTPFPTVPTAPPAIFAPSPPPVYFPPSTGTPYPGMGPPVPPAIFHVDLLVDLDTDAEEATAEISTGVIVAAASVWLLYVAVSIWMFFYIKKKDAKLPQGQKVFKGCCMIGYVLVCLFTPFVFLIIYCCVTLEQIKKKHHLVTQNKEQMGVPVTAATAQLNYGAAEEVVQEM